MQPGERKDLIGFIIAAEKNVPLLTEFLLQETADDLYAFFQKHKFTDIKKADCGDILKARIGIEETCVPPHGTPPCQRSQKGDVGPKGY